MLSYTRQAIVGLCVVLCFACGEAPGNTEAAFDASSEHATNRSHPAAHPADAPRAFHNDFDADDAPARVGHKALQSYAGITQFTQVKARCSATQGVWHETLAHCRCAPGRVFSASLGCAANTPLLPRHPACTGPWLQLPTRCLKELEAPGLLLRLNWGNGKRARSAFLAHAQADWERWFDGALALPSPPGILHLVNAKRFAPQVIAWATFDASEPLPMAAPFSPRAALHEGDAMNVVPACAAALAQAGTSAGAIAPLCEGVATTLAAVQNPDAPHAAVLRALLVSDNAQAGIALVQARYVWQGIRSVYRLPWQHDIVPSRHIISENADGESIVAFISPAGSVHAWAVGAAFFDEAGKLVH